jgi:hypothetical protein
MKTIKFLIVACLVAFLAPSVSIAQITPKGVEETSTVAAPATISLVREGERPMSQGSKNSLTIDIPKTSAKFAEKLWKDYVKQYKGDTKKDRKTDEWFTDNATIGNIGGANTVDLYAKFSESNDATTLGVWIDLGGAYVDSKEYADKYAAAEKIMTDFALTVQREQTKIQLKDQNDMLIKLERQQRNLEKDKQGLHDDIENWKKRIIKAEADIETNIKNQEDTKLKIEAQKKLVEEVQKKLNSMN